MRSYPHVYEPDGQLLLTTDYEMKGNWKQKAFQNSRDLVLELGCGRGEYTIGLAEKYPEKSFLGMDIKGARMWKGASYALQTGLRNVGFVRSRIELIERIFDAGEVDEIWITFPDPQPKKAKKRLVHSGFLKSYLQLLGPGGTIHLKTDSRLLHEYLLAILKASKVEASCATANLYVDLPEDELLSVKTHYEKKFLAEGKPITYIRFSLNGSENFIEPTDFDAKDWI